MRINFLAFAEGMYISAMKRDCAKILLLEGIEVVRHSETGQVAISVKVPLSLEKKKKKLAKHRASLSDKR